MSDSRQEWCEDMVHQRMPFFHLSTSQHVTAHHSTSPHITPHHRTSLHITAHHSTSPHITPHHRTSLHIAAHHSTSPHITPHRRTLLHITAHHSTSPHITPHRRTSLHIAAHHSTSPHITPHELQITYHYCIQPGREQSGGSVVAPLQSPSFHPYHRSPSLTTAHHRIQAALKYVEALERAELACRVIDAFSRTGLEHYQKRREVVAG
ncbi:unnamed protein product [Closterium sp. Yama58-4]|nr:unnamed protein product [Closterium sp. Yama58-4]